VDQGAKVSIRFWEKPVNTGKDKETMEQTHGFGGFLDSLNILFAVKVAGPATAYSTEDIGRHVVELSEANGTRLTCPQKMQIVYMHMLSSLSIHSPGHELLICCCCRRLLFLSPYLQHPHGLSAQLFWLCNTITSCLPRF